MTNLTDRLSEYLEIRRALGYDLAFTERVMKKFTAYADERHAEHITTALFEAWKRDYGSADTNTWAARVSMVRKFAAWLHGIDGKSEVPPRDIAIGKPKRSKPYIYSEKQIQDIVAEAARLPSEYGFRGITAATLFGLIAVTGLRINEALGLQRDHIDLSAGTLEILKSKSGNERCLPLASSTIDRLEQYLDQRQHITGLDGGPVFVRHTGVPLGDCGARYTFAQIGHRLGHRKPAGYKRHGVGPRIHDLRHTFAVRTITNWYKAGLDVDQEIYKLSAFLGHKKPQHTYWYIEAVPELMRFAADRSEVRLKKRGLQ